MHPVALHSLTENCSTFGTYQRIKQRKVECFLQLLVPLWQVENCALQALLCRPYQYSQLLWREVHEGQGEARQCQERG